MIKKLKVGDIDITKPPQTVELIPESIKYIKKEGKMTATKKTSAKTETKRKDRTFGNKTVKKTIAKMNKAKKDSMGAIGIGEVRVATMQERLNEALRHIRNAGRSIGKAFYVLTHEGHCVEIRVDCKKLEAELEAEFGKRKSKKQAKKKETK